MKILCKFKTIDGTQKIYLLSGDSWKNELVRKDMPSFFSSLMPERESTKDSQKVIRWDNRWVEEKSVQWFDVQSLEKETMDRLAIIVSSGKKAGETCNWESELAVSDNDIQKYFHEIVGQPCFNTTGILLCKLMLFRTAYSLQFRNVGIKPYTTTAKDDMGWVRMKKASNIIDKSNVEEAYRQLSSATKWYKRQSFNWNPETDSFQREENDDSDPWDTGLIHFRVRGFVDVEKASDAEILFTYVHETSHAWANTKDNKNSYGSMYIRAWAESESGIAKHRAKIDDVLLLTSADFISYVILRKAGLIEPEFLARTSWED